MLPPQYLPQPHHSLPRVRTELILGVLTPHSSLIPRCTVRGAIPSCPSGPGPVAPLTSPIPYPLREWALLSHWSSPDVPYVADLMKRPKYDTQGSESLPEGEVKPLIRPRARKG